MNRVHTFVMASMAGFALLAGVAVAQQPADRPAGPGRRPLEGRGAQRGLRAGGEFDRGGPMGLLFLLIPHDPAEILKSDPAADKDGDGELSPQERRAYAETQRAKIEKDLLAANPSIDANGDGKLSPEEMRDGRQAVDQFVMSKLLAKYPDADTHGDGKLDAEEFRALRNKIGRPGGDRPMESPVEWLLKNFQRVDTDGNGQISREELEKAKEMMPPPQAGEGFGPRPKDDAPPPADDNDANTGRSSRQDRAARGNRANRRSNRSGQE